MLQSTFKFDVIFEWLVEYYDSYLYNSCTNYCLRFVKYLFINACFTTHSASL